MSYRTLLILLLLCGIAAYFAIDPYFSYTSNFVGSKILTILLSPGFNACFWPLLFLITMRKKIGLFICRINLSVGFGYIAAKVLKCLIGRPRPFINDPSWHPFSLTNGYHSLPSGHAVISMAIFTCLATHYPRKKALFLTLGIALPFVRFLTHQHYISDILFGEALGLIAALFFVDQKVEFFYNWFLKLFGVKNDKHPPN